MYVAERLLSPQFKKFRFLCPMFILQLIAWCFPLCFLLRVYIALDMYAVFQNARDECDFILNTNFPRIILGHSLLFSQCWSEVVLKPLCQWGFWCLCVCTHTRTAWEGVSDLSVPRPSQIVYGYVGPSAWAQPSQPLRADCDLRKVLPGFLFF